MPAARRFAQDIINGRDMEEKNDKPTIITRDGAFCYDSVVELSKKQLMTWTIYLRKDKSCQQLILF